ncbi:MAG: hypothetical protein AAFR71_05645 [Pseudomonadota bacterium]
MVKQAAAQAGLDPKDVDAFSRYSMRVGTAAIMGAGGWKSVNVLTRYLEQAEHKVWA